MDESRKAYLELHAAVILFGFTAILGKWISLPAFAIVWWRVLLTSISFLFIVKISKILRETPRSMIFKYLGIGVFVAIHWVAFYGAIKMSNASLALICLATTSFMTSLIEPILLRRPFVWYELALGILILPGMYLIVNQAELDMRWGIVVGLISALFASLFTILNKKFVDRDDPKVISAIELFGVWLVLSLAAPVVFYWNPDMQWMPVGYDWLNLILLAILCTTLAYVLSMRALKHLSAFASNLVVNLEPVYGIFLAIILLKEHEELEPSFYIGVAIITFAVFSYPFIKKRMLKRAQILR